MTDKKKFIFSNLLSLVLGIVIGAGGFGIVSNIKTNEKVPEQTATLPDYGGAVIGETQENGVQMMSTAIPVEEYATYGVSEQAEKAYTITATVKPDDVSNKNIKCAFLAFLRNFARFFRTRRIVFSHTEKFRRACLPE